MAFSDLYSSILPGEKSFPGSLGESLGSIISSDPIKALGNTVQGVLGDPDGTIRRLGSQILGGGLPINPGRYLDPSSILTRDQNGVPFAGDWRVRLSFPPKLASTLYAQTLLAPLAETSGVVFPYTPAVTLNYTADWSGQKLTHSNYTPQFYNSSEIQDLQIQGQFTAMNAIEARYLLAVITFCRLATKMFFGQGENVGNPPPILHLNGYGQHHFNNVPVVLKAAQYTLPPDVDYISTGTIEGVDNSGFNVESGVTATRVPTDMAVFFTVAPIYSRAQVSTFDYNKFASGEMVKRGFI